MGRGDLGKTRGSEESNNPAFSHKLPLFSAPPGTANSGIPGDCAWGEEEGSLIDHHGAGELSLGKDFTPN